MPERFGQAYWPGVKGFISCSYTNSHGISPGIAALEIPAQDVRGISSYGTLTITDGLTTINLRRCRVVDIDFTSGQGRRIVLHIADRRWMWRYGYTTGSWNQIDPFPDPKLFPDGKYTGPGPYTPGTYRLCHDLMADCLTAMGEVNFLIAPAPAVVVPAQWDEEVPAQALQQLCDAVGYRVCYQPGLDRVLVAPAGTGLTLPDNLPIITESPSLDLPARPNTIQLVGGPTVFNDELLLEPVALERDGTIKHIDDDTLSYRPTAGWGTCPPETMSTVRATSELTQPEAADLAKQHLWRTFRVEMRDVQTNGEGPNVSGYGRVYDRKQIVLLPALYESTKQPNGQPNTEPAFVTGSVYMPPSNFYLPAGLTTTFDNSDANNGVRLPVGLYIDTARGLVSFDRQMFRLSGAAGARRWGEPILYLNTSFQIRGTIGQVPVKFLRGGTLAGLVELGCPPEVLRHPELVLVINTIRRSADKSIKTVGDNLDDLVQAADYYLAAANAKYEPRLTLDRTYTGIWGIECDGAIQQVTWSVGGQPATTRASLNTEHQQYLPSYPEKKRIIQADKVFAAASFDAKKRNAASSASTPPAGSMYHRFPPPPAIP